MRVILLRTYTLIVDMKLDFQRAPAADWLMLQLIEDVSLEMKRSVVSGPESLAG